jgi:ribosomal protein L24E
MSNEKLQKWVENVTKRTFTGGFSESLKDGTILCELISKIKARFVSYNKNPRGIEWMEKVFPQRLK